MISSREILPRGSSKEWDRGTGKVLKCHGFLVVNTTEKMEDWRRC